MFARHEKRRWIKVKSSVIHCVGDLMMPKPMPINLITAADGSICEASAQPPPHPPVRPIHSHTLSNPRTHPR